MKTIKINLWAEAPENFTGVVEHTNGDKFWYKKGKSHREDRPAIEYSDGTKAWYKEDKRHREDGPAVEYPNGSKFWYKEGKLHREDGPVIEWANGDKEWYLNGAEYYQINLGDYLILDYSEGQYGIMWYKLLDKEEIIEYPDIPGLIIK